MCLRLNVSVMCENADDAMCGMVIQMRCLKADDGDVLGILPLPPFDAYPPPSLHSPFPNPSFSGIDALLTGRSISIHPPFLVKCTFCPIPPISSRLSLPRQAYLCSSTANWRDTVGSSTRTTRR